MRKVKASPPADSYEVRTLKSLGQIVRHRRTTSALRLDDVAALCGLAAGSLSNLENGKRAISADKLLKILDGLGLAMLIVPREEAANLPPILKAERLP